MWSFAPAYRALPSLARAAGLVAWCAATRADAAHTDCPSAGDEQASPRVRRVDGALRLPLRAWARPGDWLLDNGSTRAVVRAADGVLVDFWNDPARPSSTAQLAGSLGVDALTALRSFLRIGGQEYALTSGDTRMLDGAVESRREITAGPWRLRSVTRTELADGEPHLRLTTRVEHLSGPKISGVRLGERVRWGNTSYFVDGQRMPRRFDGLAHSVGRKGAGGDLVLEALGSPFRVRFDSSQPGLAGELIVDLAEFDLEPGQSARFAQRLRYAELVGPSRGADDAALAVELRDESGQPLAAKLSLRGLLGTADPDFGDDGGEAGANRFVWSGNGRFSRPLPAGRYRVFASAGIERDAASWDVTLERGKTVRLEGRLPRVISTPGWIAADLHLHQVASPDADIANRTRVLSIAAEGVEFAVASDHYTIGNLEPALSELRKSGALASPLSVVPGTELTTSAPDFGHFNVFPLTDASRIPYENTTPQKMFAAVRDSPAQALLQVNHPRWPHGGYFSRYRLDSKSGRVPEALSADFSADFDAVEVFNGFDAWSQPILRNALRDYMALLGRGRHYTATGNSDSHGLFFVDPGLPRNLIRYGAAGRDEDDVNAPPEQVVAAVRAGQVVVSNGPVIDVALNGIGPGGTVKSLGQPVRLTLRVRAAPWIDVRHVEVLRGVDGERIRSLPIAPGRSVLRFEDSSSLPGDARTFVVVVVSGTVPLPNVYRSGVRPFAFTNPIYIEP